MPVSGQTAVALGDQLVLPLMQSQFRKGQVAAGHSGGKTERFPSPALPTEISAHEPDRSVGVHRLLKISPEGKSRLIDCSRGLSRARHQTRDSFDRKLLADECELELIFTTD